MRIRGEAEEELYAKDEDIACTAGGTNLKALDWPTTPR